jgi:3',5'-nucleoside bisphosphate phosphatase
MHTEGQLLRSENSNELFNTMITVKADLHIHTVLSPCGDLDMSPRNIVKEALSRDLQIIGITDHNSTKQIEIVEKIASAAGIKVLGGVEVNTLEEVHCLAFFPDKITRMAFQAYLDLHLPVIPNKPEIFGYQVVVDENDNILETEDRLLITAVNQSISQVEKEVHRLGGLFIAAHINRSVNSILSQLGFVPPDLHLDALEITCFTTANEVRKQFPVPENLTLIKNSDAHYPADIGKGYSLYTLKECTFGEIRLALHGREGRNVKTIQVC